MPPTRGMPSFMESHPWDDERSATLPTLADADLKSRYLKYRRESVIAPLDAFKLERRLSN